MTGFKAYPWKTLRYTDASNLGWYDVMIMKLKSVIFQELLPELKKGTGIIMIDLFLLGFYIINGLYLLKV